MIPHPLFHLAAFTGQAFIAGLWQGTVLILAVALALRLVPRLNADIRFAVWAFAFALAATLPLLPTHTSQASTHPATAVLHLSPNWGIAILSLWAFLAAFRITQLLAGIIRLRTIWHRSIPFAIEALTASRNVQLCTSTDVDAPSVIGFFAPRLLIPTTLMPRLSETELRQIVLHECEHLRRRDDWINLAQKIGLALFPLNPALLWVDRRLSLERELACDAGVVARTSAPFDYAHCLTRLADHRLRSRNFALALSAWSRQSELARRVRTLLQPISNISPLQARASLAVLSLGLLAAAAEIARAPRFVAFTEAAASVTLAETVTPPRPLTPAFKAIPATFHIPPSTRITKPRAAKPATQQSPVSEVEVASATPTPTGLPASGMTQQPPHAVLTSAIQTTSPQTKRAHIRRVSEPVYVIDDLSPTYAAVPFGDGWIIIQL